jgi:hypothetical protein
MPGRGASRPPSSTILSLSLRSSASSLSLATAGAVCAVDRDTVFQSLDAITWAGGFTAGRVVGAESVLMARSIACPIYGRHGVKPHRELWGVPAMKPVKGDVHFEFGNDAATDFIREADLLLITAHFKLMLLWNPI